MRHDDLYLADIIEAAEAIEKFLHGVKREDFTGNDLLRSAVLQKLSIIGEAAARVSKDFQNKHPEIEWADIVAFRNIAIHAYFMPTSPSTGPSFGPRPRTMRLISEAK